MNQIKKDSSGLTLIETTVAILLIGLLFIALFGIFLSTKKMGVASEKIVDATYIAQHELESVYQMSKTVSVSSLVEVKPDSFCTENKPLNATDYTCERNLSSHPYIKDTSKYSINIKFTKATETAIAASNFYNVIVTIKENHTIKATMESLYKFKN